MNFDYIFGSWGESSVWALLLEPVMLCSSHLDRWHRVTLTGGEIQRDTHRHKHKHILGAIQIICDYM